MDLTQETFARAYQHLDGFRQESQASTWLLRIARNLCLNRLKYLSRRGAGRSGPLDELTEAELLGGVELPGRPDEALEQARARARVQRAIDALGEEQRVLVVLRDIEGLSYTEIAQVTELPEGTVRSRLHRAREKLAELLADTSERGT